MNERNGGGCGGEGGEEHAVDAKRGVVAGLAETC